MLTQIPKGTIIDGRYEILELIGGGGMGSVFKAKELGLGRTVALKFIHDTQITSGDGIARFEREGQIMSGLTHRNIAMLYRFASWNDTPYIAMEYVPGHSLRDELDNKRRLTVQEVVALGIQLTDALSHAHQKGFVHRDIKPPNIILVDNEQQELIKIIDFGLARIITGDEIDKQRLTQTGTLIGSVQYMSPEQCLGGKADARSDIYSLGCVLYECLAGEPPLVADNPVGMLHLHVNETPKSLARTTGSLKLPSGLEDVIFKAMAKNATDRYASMAEFNADLVKISEGKSRDLIASPFRIPRKKESLDARIIIATSVMLLATAGVCVWFNDTLLFAATNKIIDATNSERDAPRTKLDLADYLAQIGRAKVADDLASEVAPTATQMSARKADMILQKLIESKNPQTIDKVIQLARAHFLKAKLARELHRESYIDYILAFQNSTAVIRATVDKRQMKEIATVLWQALDTLKKQPIPPISKDRQVALEDAAVETISRTVYTYPQLAEGLLSVVLSRQRSFDDNSVELLIALSRVASHQGRYDEGLKYLSEIEKHKIGRHQRYGDYTKSRILALKGDWNQALKYAIKANTQDYERGDDLMFYTSQVAAMQLRMEQLKEAEATCRVGLTKAERIPDMVEAQRQLPLSLIAQGRIKEAEQVTDRMLELYNIVKTKGNPTEYRLLLLELNPHLASIYKVLGRTDRALELLNEGLALHQDIFFGYDLPLMLAETYIQRGEFAEATKVLNGRKDSYIEVLILLSQNRTAEARKIAEKESPSASKGTTELALAQIELKEGRIAKAHELAGKACNLMFQDDIHWLEARKLYNETSVPR